MHKTLLWAILLHFIHLTITYKVKTSVIDRQQNDETNLSPSQHVDQFNDHQSPNSSEDNIYSKEEIDCFTEKKFLVMGKCYELGSKGPCAENELLLLNKPTNQSGDIIRPICKPKLCNGDNEVWWPMSKKCEQISWILTEHCNEMNAIVVVDCYGEGVCRHSSNDEQITTIDEKKNNNHEKISSFQPELPSPLDGNNNSMISFFAITNPKEINTRQQFDVEEDDDYLYSLQQQKKRT